MSMPIWLDPTIPKPESYTLDELTQIAREKAKGAHGLDLRKVRCTIQGCGARQGSTHVHGRSYDYRQGMICLEPGELALPKHLQLWLIGHECTHFHTMKGHRSKIFHRIAERLIGSNEQELWREYWQYRRDHESEIRSFSRHLVASKNKAPELTIDQELTKLRLGEKRLSTKLKRTTTALRKVQSKIKRLEKKSTVDANT